MFARLENFAYVQIGYMNKAEKRKVKYILFEKKLKLDKFPELIVQEEKGLNCEEIDKQDLPEHVLLLL